ncbi:MAG: HPF/RaiA family ribosome-associated protein [Gammaproteobacteria bacterium]|nr:MAG: HPF/RaiA family ribosome-associated protein [Gammaproteobacteria bacterium]
MQITIQSRGFSLTEALENRVKTRLGFTLAHGDNRIRSVAVKLSDLNGPRGGVDKRCLIEARINGLPPVVVQDIQSDMYTAIDRAADRDCKPQAWQGS